MKLFLKAVFVFILCCPPMAVRAAEDPEISVREMHAFGLGGIFPVYVDIRSVRPVRVDVAVEVGEGVPGFAVRRTVQVPANSFTRVEIPVAASSYATVRTSCSSGGQVWKSESFVPYRRNADDMDTVPRPLFCVNNYLFRALSGAFAIATATEIDCDSVRLEDLPRTWQSYLGLIGSLVFEADEAAKLDPAQMEALGFWLRWLNGTVWLVGPGARETVAALGMEQGFVPETLPDGLVRYRTLGGALYLLEKEDAAAIIRNNPVGIINYERSRRGAFENPLFLTPGLSLDGLGGVSIAVIILSLGLLGLAMGPLNYFFIKKRRQPLLFFVTTPLIALVGTFLIFVASAVNEGFAGRYREAAVLSRRTGSDEAVLTVARAVRPGFFIPSLTYPEDAFVAPFPAGGRGDSYVVETGAGTRLVSGWVNPRAVSCIVAALPVACRMRVELVKEGERWYAVNGLGYQVMELAARLPEGNFGKAEDIAPGEKKLLKIERSAARLRELTYRADSAGVSPAVERVRLAAWCRGLPYVEGWGMNGTRLDGEYGYFEVGPDAGEDE